MAGMAHMAMALLDMAQMVMAPTVMAPTVMAPTVMAHADCTDAADPTMSFISSAHAVLTHGTGSGILADRATSTALKDQVILSDQFPVSSEEVVSAAVTVKVDAGGTGMEKGRMQKSRRFYSEVL
ncbi:jg16898 [Pararge aegeria aegeria]|uniref:Jg16898 protein n=1 Tax=Pararge aegeria aegeria TaxID=348720 RepID=A0A8S4SLX7_9NEOP|nr:jg16898 [Pararge aegeria aegeria]